MTTRPQQISERFVESVCTRLEQNEPVRRSLPSWGRLHIDRQLPFLAVYRRPGGRPDAETSRFVVAEASYLTVDGARRLAPDVCRLARRVAETLAGEFGAFLIVEVWSEHGDGGAEAVPPPPRFRIHVPSRESVPATVESLASGLRRVRVRSGTAEVEVVSARARHAPGFRPLVSRSDALAMGCHWLGVSVRPIWRQSATGALFPLLRRTLSRRFGQATRRAFFEFTREKTTHRPPHFHSLGRRVMVKAVSEVDAQLAEVDSSFDFLLNVTPANAHAAHVKFKKAGYRGTPVFEYRPLPADPAILKRRLYDIRIERIEDPTIALLFREKRRELDLQLNILIERNTPRALFGSLQLYGPVDDALLATANQILESISPRSREQPGGYVDAKAFAERAQSDIDGYRRQNRELTSAVHVRDDMVGLMVSKGDLLVGRRLRVASARVEALLQHEVGTHILTHFNGRMQPFRQLHCGLAGYDELQEGLAVFAEYLVGGLSRPRLRLLAARVVAARCITEGLAFEDTHALLVRKHGFDQSTAFTIAMRIYRAGGLTKDAIYLRGLIRLLAYVKDGGDLELLLVGKIAEEHVPVIRELRRRKILNAPALRPRYLDHPAAERNLQRAREGIGILDVAEGV